SLEALREQLRLRPLPAAGSAQKNDTHLVSLAPPAPDPALLQEPRVVVLDELALDLLDRVHGHADDDQERGPAEVEVEAESLCDEPGKHGIEGRADPGKALDLETARQKLGQEGHEGQVHRADDRQA